jgi:hypothetical protein
MTVNRNDVVTIPKWLVIVLLPMFFGAMTGYGAYKISSTKYEIEIQNLKSESEKKINKAEVEIQFNDLRNRLTRIEEKLDRNGRIIQDNQ